MSPSLSPSVSLCLSQFVCLSRTLCLSLSLASNLIEFDGFGELSPSARFTCLAGTRTGCPTLSRSWLARALCRSLSLCPSLSHTHTYAHTHTHTLSLSHTHGCNGFGELRPSARLTCLAGARTGCPALSRSWSERALCRSCITALSRIHSATRNRRLRVFSRCSQFTRVSFSPFACFNCHDLNHKPLDSGERQSKSRARKRQFSPARSAGGTWLPNAMSLARTLPREA